MTYEEKKMLDDTYDETTSYWSSGDSTTSAVVMTMLICSRKLDRVISLLEQIRDK